MKIRFKIILGILFFAFFIKVQNGHAQLFLRMDSIVALEPIIMNDTVDFEVHVGVRDLLAPWVPSFTVGNIFYWYRTDSMINSGQPARIIDVDLSSLLILDGYVDTVPIEMKPNEIRMGGTNPINLIILWPALFPPILDTIPDTLGITVVGVLGDNDVYPKQVGNVIFPCPALQFLNIQQGEISKIRQITILSMDGKVAAILKNHEFSSGFINLESFPTGEYFIRSEYFDNRVVQTKVIKQ